MAEYSELKRSRYIDDQVRTSHFFVIFNLTFVISPYYSSYLLPTHPFNYLLLVYL